MYIPTPLVSPGYGMYNTCDRAAPFGSRVKKRDRLGLYCLTGTQITQLPNGKCENLTMSTSKPQQSSVQI